MTQNNFNTTKMNINLYSSLITLDFLILKNLSQKVNSDSNLYKRCTYNYQTLEPVYIHKEIKQLIKLLTDLKNNNGRIIILVHDDRNYHLLKSCLLKNPNFRVYKKVSLVRTLKDAFCINNNNLNLDKENINSHLLIIGDFFLNNNIIQRIKCAGIHFISAITLRKNCKQMSLYTITNDITAELTKSVFITCLVKNLLIS